MRFRVLFPAIAASVMAAVAPACSSEDGPDSVTPALYDIVTYVGQSDGSALFEFRRDGDSPLVELAAPGYENPELEDGQRILLGYVPESGRPFESGTVRVIGWSQIVADRLRQGNPDGWDADAVYLNSIWRSGRYINMECRVEYSTESRKLYLMVDEETTEDPVPQLYVYHDRGDVDPGFSRLIYCSWDISALWNKDECEGVDVHLRDSNRNIDVAPFRK